MQNISEGSVTPNDNNELYNTANEGTPPDIEDDTALDVDDTRAAFFDRSGKHKKAENLRINESNISFGLN